MGTISTQKRTEITVETHRVVTIRRRQTLQVWCRECGRLVDVISPEEAGTMAGMSQPKLQDRAGTGNWHICDGWNGETVVCLESVLKSI